MEDQPTTQGEEQQQSQQHSRSAILIVELECTPGRFVLMRTDWPGVARMFVWCGRSLGWRPLDTTSSAFFQYFCSKQEARKIADKYITLPLQQE